VSIRKIFETQLAQERSEVAKNALKQAFRGEIPGSMTMKQIMAELQADEYLWAAFESLPFSELRSAIAPPAAAAPGPTRKRGVTTNRIVEFVRKNPGVRRQEIMRAIGLKGGAVSSQLRTMKAEGKLRGEGVSRKLRYFVD